MAYQLLVVGGVDDGFTSVEIRNIDGLQIARVFELTSGWHAEMRDLAFLRDQALVDAILDAQDTLRHYVNRRGVDVPEGLTRGGFSLWLMQRDDGKGLTIQDGN